MHSIQHVTTIPTLADLKTFPGNEGGVTLLLGRLSPGDGDGATFYWDEGSTEAEELDNLTVVSVPRIPVGRWKRVFNRRIILPHGILTINAGVKTFWTTATYQTDATSRCTLRLTVDNTLTGAPIFSQILLNYSAPLPRTTAANDMIFSNVEVTSADLRSTTHVYARGSSVTLGANLGQIINQSIAGLRNAATGTLVRFKVEGL